MAFATVMFTIPFDEDEDLSQGSAATEAVGRIAACAAAQVRTEFPAKVAEETAKVTFTTSGLDVTVPVSEILPADEAPES